MVKIAVAGGTGSMSPLNKPNFLLTHNMKRNRDDLSSSY
jgi:hypothetical protein